MASISFEIGATVVLPTINRPEAVANCVMDLLRQTHRPLEILIVDQSDDPSEELRRLAHEHSDVIRWHRVSFRGLPAARNYGWRNASHEAIIFVDDDIRCGRELVSEHVRGLCQPGVAVVAGAIDEARPVERTGRTGAFRSWTATPDRGFDAHGEFEVDHAPGGNFSTWRAVLSALGGIDEDLQVGAALYEETDYCLRVRAAGFRLYFSGRARLTHLAVPTAGCRVPDMGNYVFGLGHNRSVLIHRHLRWYHMPTALFELGRLAVAYSVKYRRLALLGRMLKGSILGFRTTLKSPLIVPRKGISQTVTRLPNSIQ